MKKILICMFKLVKYTITLINNIKQDFKKTIRSDMVKHELRVTS